MRRRSVPEGIRITKVGLWYVLFTLIVSLAATNTGNNALYMVLSVMFGVLIVSGVVSRQNVRGLEVAVEPPGELFANRPFALSFTVRNRGRLLPRWFLLFSVGRTARPLLIPFLPRRGRSAGALETMLPSRGHHRFPWAHVSSLFPFGFFRKGERYRLELEVLVFPEIFPAASTRREADDVAGEAISRRSGLGHDLHSLRAFRRGDDPRGIHWKQTARTGEMIYMEREAEKSRRLSILFDNAVGPLADPALAARFERLVSEAATAAVDYLAHGYQVELVTRDRVLPFAGGPRQRFAVLEALALIQPLPEPAGRAQASAPLMASDPRAPRLRLHLEPRSAEEIAV